MKSRSEDTKSVESRHCASCHSLYNHQWWNSAVCIKRIIVSALSRQVSWNRSVLITVNPESRNYWLYSAVSTAVSQTEDSRAGVARHFNCYVLFQPMSFYSRSSVFSLLLNVPSSLTCLGPQLLESEFPSPDSRRPNFTDNDSDVVPYLSTSLPVSDQPELTD